jgi:hypothetical protein
LKWWNYDELGERIDRLHTRGICTLSIDDIQR